MEARLIRMVTVPLIAGRIRPCVPELRSHERMSLPLTPIDASPPAGLTLDDDRRSFSRTRQAAESSSRTLPAAAKNAETAAVLNTIAATLGMPDAWVD
jgi:hypothetical protein